MWREEFAGHDAHHHAPAQSKRATRDTRICTCPRWLEYVGTRRKDGCAACCSVCSTAAHGDNAMVCGLVGAVCGVPSVGAAFAVIAPRVFAACLQCSTGSLASRSWVVKCHTEQDGHRWGEVEYARRKSRREGGRGRGERRIL